MSVRPKIVVAGSLNVDHTFHVPRLPLTGETLTASGAFTCFGGKGANQALAAARAGGDVTLIGCAGEDDFGSRYIEYLRNEGIRTDAILKSATPTGSAFIAVDGQGENLIIVNPGANHAVEPLHVEAHADLIRGADALLLQLECPLPAVVRAAEIAREGGVPVILNPSPLTPEFIQSGIGGHTLIVNELEHAALLPLAIAKWEQLVITCGSKPTRVIRAAQTISVEPPKVTPVDTVGAGDTFAGAFVVALCEGRPLEEAIAFANAAGALATLKHGAQTAIPHREEVLQFMRAQESLRR